MPSERGRQIACRAHRNAEANEFNARLADKRKALETRAGEIYDRVWMLHYTEGSKSSDKRRTAKADRMAKAARDAFYEAQS